MDSVRCAVIGVGNMGQHHARVYSQLAQLVAVCDLDQKRGKAVADLYGALYYDSVDKMLDSKKIDVVSIAVPSKYHREIAAQTISSGIATLVEKPITTTVDDAEFLVNLAKKKKVTLMVGHVERFNPVVQALKKQLQKNVFGDVITITAVRSGINPPQEKHSHVGLDLTIHDLDICLYLLEETPQASVVYTQRVNNDQAVDSVSALVKFSSATASFSTNWLSPIKVRKLTLTGTKGYAEVDYVKQTLKVFNRPPEVKNSNYQELQSLGNAKPKRIHVVRREPLKNELEFFLKNYKQPAVISLLTRDAVIALKILLQ